MCGVRPYQINPVRRSEPPSQGYWPKGAIVWRHNTSRVALPYELLAVGSDSLGWVCEEAGRPGQWRDFGASYTTGATTRLVADLDKIAKLRQAAMLTEDEFVALKQRLISNM